MDTTLWPCRGVAEYAYCPRLFYYMTVEGVFLPSADTEQGAGVHRRVDQPSAMTPQVDKSKRRSKQIEKLEDDQSDPERPRSIRSLALTSHRLGLTATLDLAEIEGTLAIPVEYRKGRPRHDTLAGAKPSDEMMEAPQLLHAPEPWPTDRVQIGLHVLLLEEAGYTVPEAYLYYAAEKLRLRVPVDDALRRDALAILETAKRTAGGPRPPPLLNDPKCPKCSLQPICLPDEINHQRLAARAVEGAGPSRMEALWPARPRRN